MLIVNKVIVYLLLCLSVFSYGSYVYAQTNECSSGVKLGMPTPGVGQCIANDNKKNSLPQLFGGMSKLLVNIILMVAFIMIVLAGVLMSMYGFNQ